ncbi:fibronectin type III domain-containing protein [Actinophytocola glycyrrhizae]|uniref:Fibronectin type III domain-containing protein n=1 Tax=Actinophytocola glycyrrhizae TaxID=2044873 RepID=A0ABV9S7L0_9PSEU
MAFASGAGRAAICLAVLASACSSADANDTGLRLSASLTGDDVTLTWKGHGGDVAVEFATEPDGRYTILGFVPRAQTRFEHPDLMPATTFYYRVRPVEGPTSDVATVVPATDRVEGEDWLVPRTVPDERAAPKRGGAPANLVVESVGPDALRLTWTDNAADETGHLVEREVGGTFEVAFVVDANVNRVGLLGESADTYRVRAYRFGEMSNVVSERTP